MIYKEWAPTPSDRKGRMLPESAFSTILTLRDPGYSSVYGFSEEHAETIKASGSSKGFANFPVYSNSITLDLDGGDSSLAVIGSKLDLLGYGFQVYSSGGKGYHIILQHDMAYDIRVPYSQASLAKSILGDDFRLVDASIFRPNSLISLPGRVHPKTKNKKTLVFTKQGKDLGELPLVERPELDFDSFKQSGTGLTNALLNMSDWTTCSPEEGNRHMTLWKLAKDLCAAGLEHSTVLDLLNKVNETWETPKSQEDVAAAVGSVFRNMKES